MSYYNIFWCVCVCVYYIYIYIYFPHSIKQLLEKYKLPVYIIVKIKYPKRHRKRHCQNKST